MLEHIIVINTGMGINVGIGYGLLVHAVENKNIYIDMNDEDLKESLNLLHTEISKRNLNKSLETSILSTKKLLNSSNLGTVPEEDSFYQQEPRPMMPKDPAIPNPIRPRTPARPRTPVKPRRVPIKPTPKKGGMDTGTMVIVGAAATGALAVAGKAMVDGNAKTPEPPQPNTRVRKGRRRSRKSTTVSF